jgi:ferric-dicitrate binding protein FerR (iron transport regulator)
MENELRKFLSRQFGNILNDKELAEKKLDSILYRIHYEINSREPEKGNSKAAHVFRWITRIAAVIIIPLMVVWGVRGYFTARARQQAWVEIKAPAWTRAQFTLPDGTTGWLNSNSSIRYNQDFLNERQVTVDGEAYLDVYRDEKRPFRVVTEEVVLKVLGTRFNLASYRDEPNVEVVLEEGSLTFSDRDEKNNYSMKPDDLVNFDKQSGDFTTEVVQTQKYLAWKDGKLVFRNDPLDVICRRLARWYNVDVDVNVSSVENLRLRATFTDENLEEVLDLLRRSLPIDYSIRNGSLNPDNTYSKKKVTILPRKRQT